jgi:hypothetical protein
MDKEVVSNLDTKRSFILPASFYQTWIMTGGVYMMAGRCPCCGGQACAVGLGTAALVGGTIAGLTHGAGALRKVINNRKKKA